MHNHRLVLFAVLISCVLLAAGVLPSAYAATPPKTPRTVLRQFEKMRETEPHLRSQERKHLVNLCGTGASRSILPLLGPINTDDADVNFVQHCVLAIGETAEKSARNPLPPGDYVAATKALQKYLTGRDVRLAFAACETLKKVWKGKGADAKLKPLNAELLACLYKHWPPLLEHSASSALAAINRIPGKSGSKLMPMRLTPEEMREIVIGWFAKNDGRLPPLAARPWALKLQALASAPSPPERDNAARLLMDAGKLAPVDPMLDLLAVEDAVTADVHRKIAIILQALTGRPFPPKGVEPEDQVAEWRTAWYASLKTTPTPIVKSTAWMILEFSLRRYTQAPSEEMAGRITAIRLVIAHVLADPEGIPANASGAARKLLTVPLESKRAIVKILVEYDEAADGQTRQNMLRKLRQAVDKTGREVVTVQFTQTFLDRAHAAEVRSDRTSGDVFALLLGIATKVPCELKGRTVKERMASLNAWLDLVKKQGWTLKMPPAPAVPPIAPPP
jgi:hypothetical protein